MKQFYFIILFSFLTFNLYSQETEIKNGSLSFTFNSVILKEYNNDTILISSIMYIIDEQEIRKTPFTSYCITYINELIITEPKIKGNTFTLINTNSGKRTIYKNIKNI